jgi:hypothetical protein
MMSRRNIDVKRFSILNFLPWKVEPITNFSFKAGHQKPGVRVIDLVYVVTQVRMVADGWNRHARRVCDGLELICGTHLKTHMSGLRGLFVWKPKATTDAPDA